MGRPPNKWSELHHGDESAEVVYLRFLVLPIHHSRQVEQLGALETTTKTTLKTSNRKLLNVLLQHLDRYFLPYACLNQVSSV